ncbi:DUF5391 family protein [Bacillus massilinigeriensis]|uniref:DUF5391 family protein n=1 Tax=Bacillus mediterraneensis TaxID=1805474 RepID=UPI0008F8EB2B|nr:DUF5391 family protein [Bacillus mediterraneensis]
MRSGEKRKLVLITLCSAMLFLCLVAAAFLSPLQQNPQSAEGMVAFFGITLALYVIPLLLYVLGVRMMKYVMAAFCCVGILAVLLTFLIVIMFAESTSYRFSDFFLAVFFCIGVFVVNIEWLYTALQRDNSTQENSAERQGES